MEILKWTLVGLMGLSALATVGTVGKERKPLQPSDAVFSVLINGAFIYWVLNTL